MLKKKKRALIVYWSGTGNTKKVAKAIKKGLEDADITITVRNPEEAQNIDFFDYDLICVGPPSYSWHLPEPMAKFLKKKLVFYRKQDKIIPTSPKVLEKNTLIFVTYSGPHTGSNEATPVGKDMRQFFEHIGFNIIYEWYILSEYQGSLELNTKGKMEDIRGKTTEETLQIIRENAKGLVNTL